GNAYPVKGLFVQSTNPVMSDPNRDRVQEMFRHLELGVAIEIFMSGTALECDIVLPETSFYEHAEIRNGMWLGPEVILCQPVVAPLGEAKPRVRSEEHTSELQSRGHLVCRLLLEKKKELKKLMILIFFPFTERKI